mgnify:FL=1
MIKKITDKDKKDWEDFLSKKETLFKKDQDNSKSIIPKVKTVDLHGYTLDAANEFIKTLIKKSFNENVKKLIIITGKGIHSDNEKNPYKSKDFSILKYSVPEFIKNEDELIKIVKSIKEASEEDGGKGAFYVYLKKNNNSL